MLEIQFDFSSFCFALAKMTYTIANLESIQSPQTPNYLGSSGACSDQQFLLWVS